MKAIFKIIKYNPERQQIVVRFARLRAPESIEKYRKIAVNLSHLDCYDSESFVKSLMRRFGNEMVKQQEEKEPIINEAETISEELNLQDFVHLNQSTNIKSEEQQIYHNQIAMIQSLL